MNISFLRPCPASGTSRVATAFAAALCLITFSAAPRALAQSCTTTITGKVYSPNGPAGGDPIPNILVYVATTPVQALPQGLTSCAGASQLVTGTPLVSTTTDATGKFVLNSTGLAALGSSVNVVIQAGKWRRQNAVAITPCATTTVNLTMPANQSQGDLPHIAVVTGQADGVECIFRRIGISDSEFTDPSGTGSINLYEGTGTLTSGGAVVLPATTTVPTEDQLIESASKLNTYDLVMFGCQGTGTDAIASTNANGALDNLVSYANTGGRIFATHYGYVWLDNIQPFESSANWIKDQGTITEPGFPTGTGVATIDTTYSQSAVLAQWLQTIGASYLGQYGQMELFNIREDQNKVNKPPAQSWLNLNNYPNNPSMQFTFDTPVNATTTPSVALTFANNPTAFQEGDAADKITIGVTDTSTTTSADSSLNLTLTVPSGVTPVSLAGVGATGWICSVGTLTCNRTTPLGPSVTDSILLTVAIAANAPLGDANVTATVAGGGLSGTNQCGRVLYNDYHVENSASTGQKYPTECSTAALTPQEKFLEFSLYNLSNFVAPVTNDVIDIQTGTTVAWATPSSIYYGTPLGPNQLNATATVTGSTTPVPGTFTYSPAAGTVLPVGTNTLNVTFTPTDPTAYTGSTGSTTILVLPDTTTTTLTSSPNPSVFGNSVAFTATVVGNAAAPVGVVYFYDAGVPIGQATLTASTGDASAATLNITTLATGTHSITAVYNPSGVASSPSNSNFKSSTSLPLSQVVLGVSVTSITGLVSPIDYGQIIGNTAVVSVAGSSSGGTVTVYINGVNVCVLPVNQGAQNTCPASTGAGYQPGTYSIYAVFSGDALYAGSTSPTYTVQVVPDPTTTTVISSLNPSRLTNSITFTATVTAPYATPTGTVVLYDGTTQLGVGTLTALNGTSATATYSTSALAVGSHNITVSYPATTDFNASVTAPALVQVVLPPLPFNGAPGYTLTVTPIQLDAPIGAGTPITVTIQEFNGYNAAIALSCSPLPTESTCGFTNATVPPGGGTVTLYLTPGAPHACGANPPYFVASNGTKGIVWMSALTLCLLCTRRRRLLRGLTLALALCFLPVLNGCGTGCTDFGTKPGTYSFTVTAVPTTNPGPAGSPTGPNSQTITFNATL
jgi:hypothetical protein